MKKYPPLLLVKCCMYTLLVLPHLLCFFFSKNNYIIQKDIERNEVDGVKMNSISPYFALWLLLVKKKEFRCVFYKRIGFCRHILQLFLPPLKSVDIYGCDIGPGFVLIHGYLVIINPRCKIGKNCTCLHNVTIGETTKGHPIIGDDVFIGTGVKIIGPIRIGNNVKIGAGAIVVEDVPDNSTVVSNKAQIIKR